MNHFFSLRFNVLGKEHMDLYVLVKPCYAFSNSTDGQVQEEYVG